MTIKRKKAMTAVYLSEAERETPRRRHCLNSMAGHPTPILKMKQMKESCYRIRAELHSTGDNKPSLSESINCNQPVSLATAEPISSTEGKTI